MAASLPPDAAEPSGGPEGPPLPPSTGRLEPTELAVNLLPVPADLPSALDELRHNGVVEERTRAGRYRRFEVVRPVPRRELEGFVAWRSGFEHVVLGGPRWQVEQLAAHASPYLQTLGEEADEAGGFDVPAQLLEQVCMELAAAAPLPLPTCALRGSAGSTKTLPVSVPMTLVSVPEGHLRVGPETGLLIDDGKERQVLGWKLSDEALEVTTQTGVVSASRELARVLLLLHPSPEVRVSAMEDRPVPELHGRLSDALQQALARRSALWVLPVPVAVGD